MKKVKQVTNEIVTFNIGDIIFHDDVNVYGKITEFWEVDNCFNSGKTYVVMYIPICNEKGISCVDTEKSANINDVIPAKEQMEDDVKRLEAQHNMIKYLIERVKKC